MMRIRDVRDEMVRSFFVFYLINTVGFADRAGANKEGVDIRLELVKWGNCGGLLGD